FSRGARSGVMAIVLRQPTLQELIAALDLLHARVSGVRRASSRSGRTEILVYYSGHAEEQGLAATARPRRLTPSPAATASSSLRHVAGARRIDPRRRASTREMSTREMS
ncbi:MAG TPA: hypothetical protein VFT47_12865, partial [Vicinamibacterales bacterium]|nr:hypothetical protein [Vicinamibacterales bacterium]